MVTPVTQKLNAAKQKRFAKCVVTLDLLNMADNHCPGVQSQRVISSRTKREDPSHRMDNKARVMQKYQAPRRQWYLHMKTPTRLNDELVNGWSING